MSVYQIGKGLPKYIGLSTDTKPTAADPQNLQYPEVGSTYLEGDTGKLFVTYDRTNWGVKDSGNEYGSWVDATITIATDDDLTAAVDLGADYDTLIVYIPTLTSAELTLYVSETLAGTYYAVGNSVTVAAGTGGFIDVWILGGARYIKIGTSAAQGANRTFRVRGIRS